MEKIKDRMKNKNFKNIIYGVCAVVLIVWVVFRFAVIGAENSMAVFNTARYSADVGAPVYALKVHSQNGVLREPIAVKNNKALVSAYRVDKLKTGQRVGNGEITSVSKDIDLNTGMHIVRTRGVEDGLHYAEFETTGYFVPLYAVNNNMVMVADNGIATPRKVNVIRQDAENALVEGLNDGDIVVLSKVNAGDKVQIKE